MSEPLLTVEHLSVHFRKGVGLVRGLRHAASVVALDGVSIAVRPNETVALVGESGSGKTTLGRVMVGLQQPTTGTVRLHGRELSAALRSEFMRTRRMVQIIFQDPNGSLTPWMPVGEAIAEPLRRHGLCDRRAAQRRVAELLEMVGLQPEHADRYPREFSGGQRQRIAIARALALSPEIVVCDEITSGLDASVRARIINLLSDLRRQREISFVFITHDLHVARTVADRIAVMSEGRIVELDHAGSVFDRPQHPYTRQLLAAQPVLPPLTPDDGTTEGSVP